MFSIRLKPNLHIQLKQLWVGKGKKKTQKNWQVNID